MPRVKSVERRRANHAKSRKGCLTCKGKEPEDQIMQFHLEYLTHFPVTPHSSPHQLPSHPDDTQTSRRAFEFFCTVTCGQLSTRLEGEFWSRFVVPLASQDSTVRSAVSAFAAFHEDFMRGINLTKEVNYDALQMYNSAIIEHVRNSDPSVHLEPAVAFVPCLIFAIIEMLRGNLVAFTQLISKSFPLILAMNRERGENEDRMSQSPLYVIIIMFRNFVMDACGASRMLGSEAWLSLDVPNLDQTRRSMPCVFSSVLEARRFLDALAQAFVSEGCHDEIPLSSDTDIRIGCDEHWKETLASWTAAFEGFLATDETLSKADLQEARILQIRSLHYQISLDVSLREGAYNQMVWDQYLPQYEVIVNLSEALCEDSNNKDAKPFLSLGRWLVGPLSDIAVRCRDPGFRRRAVATLERFPQRDGFMDGRLAIEAAKRCIEIEEGGSEVLCADNVPESRRISRVRAIPDSVRQKVSLRYFRYTDGNDPSGLEVEEPLG
ncbi:hypothetical protein JX266_004155 [Neoarthrinium moseri]|nr:hypothetical protein JX266_004155 [Neoarthrinium moseri]